MIFLKTENYIFEVEFQHNRNFIEHPNPKKSKIDPYTNKPKTISKGGKTICLLTMRDNENKALMNIKAISECSIYDMYNRAIGRDISFGRAIKRLEQNLITQNTAGLHESFREKESKEERNEVLKEFSKKINEIKDFCKDIKNVFNYRGSYRVDRKEYS